MGYFPGRIAAQALVRTFVLAGGPGGAGAAPRVPGGPPATDFAADIPWLRVVWATLLVVGLICLGVYLLKKLGGSALLGRGRYMDVLEARPLGRKMHLFLVRVAGRVVLLSVSGENVTRLAEFPEQELPELEETHEAGPRKGFGQLMRSLAGVSE